MSKRSSRRMGVALAALALLPAAQPSDARTVPRRPPTTTADHVLGRAPRPRRVVPEGSRDFLETAPPRKFWLGFIPFFGWPGYLQCEGARDAASAASTTGSSDPGPPSSWATARPAPSARSPRSRSPRSWRAPQPRSGSRRPTFPSRFAPGCRWVLGETREALCPTLETRGVECALARAALARRSARAAAASRSACTRTAPRSSTLPGGGETWPEDVTRRRARARRRREARRAAAGGAPRGRRRTRSAAASAGRACPGAHRAAADRRGLAAPRRPRRRAPRARRRRPPLAARERATQPSGGERRLELEVHRKVTDDVPLLLETQRRRSRSRGPPREERLGPRAPAAASCRSRSRAQLPARFDPDGTLARAGAPGPLRRALHRAPRGPAPSRSRRPEPADGAAPGPPSEIWVFEARPALRLVTVEGAGVDPQQTSLPDDWQRAPRVSHGARRDAAARRAPARRRRARARRARARAPLAPRLRRRRRDGVGPARGPLHARTRLEMGGGHRPRPRVGERRRPVPDAAGRGRQGRRPAPAGRRHGRGGQPRRGRRARAARRRAGTHDVASLRASLELPPGYELFHASGVDRAHTTWLARWTLLDYFLFAIVAASRSLRLFGVAAAARSRRSRCPHRDRAGRAPLGLARRARGRGAPARGSRGSLAPHARARARARRFARLLVVARAVRVDALRAGLYPALGPQGAAPAAGLRRRARRRSRRSTPAPAAEPEAAIGCGASDGRGRRRRARTAARARASGRWRYAAKAPGVTEPRLPRRRPDARITTGPGIPTWRGARSSSTWSGPVARGETLRLWLIPPWGNALAALLRAVLLGAPRSRRARPAPAGARGRAWWAPPPPRRRPAALLLALAVLTAPSAPARAAEFPSDELLKELRERLPSRRRASRAASRSRGSRLDARAALALKLARRRLGGGGDRAPAAGQRGELAPRERRAIGRRPARRAAARRGRHALAARRAGRARGRARGPAPRAGRERRAAAAARPAPRRGAPRRAGRSSASRPDGGVEAALQLVRDAPRTGRRDEARGAGRASALRARRARRSRSGSPGRRRRTVVRLSPIGEALVLEVPLLAGESVTTPGVEVRERRARVSLAPGDAVRGVDARVLALGRRARARAPRGRAVDRGIGRCARARSGTSRPSGIPPIQARPAAAAARLAWRPWPGETRATPGRSDPTACPARRSRSTREPLALRPGLRSTDATLALGRPEQPGRRAPRDAAGGRELQRVAIDGTEQPLRQEGRAVVVPLAPGPLRRRARLAGGATASRRSGARRRSTSARRR